jgi:hypothetical protein
VASGKIARGPSSMLLPAKNLDGRRRGCHRLWPLIWSHVRINGVPPIFGLAGDSLTPIADVVGHGEIEWIGVRYEEGAALGAAGQAKLIGRLGVCRGTTEPGSTHLVAGLHEASRDHAPVLALSGEMPRQKPGTEYFKATCRLKVSAGIPSLHELSDYCRVRMRISKCMTTETG